MRGIQAAKKAIVFAATFAGVMLGGLRADTFAITISEIHGLVFGDPNDPVLLAPLTGTFTTDGVCEVCTPGAGLLSWEVGSDEGAFFQAVWELNGDGDSYWYGSSEFDRASSDFFANGSDYGGEVLSIGGGLFYSDFGGVIFAYGVESTVDPVPEPASLCLLAGALLCCAGLWSRWQRAAKAQQKLTPAPLV